MNIVHSIETTPLKHILKQINQKYGISQEEIEELSADNSMGSLAERQFALIWRTNSSYWQSYMNLKNVSKGIMQKVEIWILTWKSLSNHLWETVRRVHNINSLSKLFHFHKTVVKKLLNKENLIGNIYQTLIINWQLHSKFWTFVLNKPHFNI